MTDSADYNRSVGTRMAPRDEALRLEAMAESELDISTDPPPRKRRKLNGNREERSEEERNVPSAPPASNSNVRDYALRPRRAEQ